MLPAKSLRDVAISYVAREIGNVTSLVSYDIAISFPIAMWPLQVEVGAPH